jgi:hypothetical protein
MTTPYRELFARFDESARRWWQGEFVPHENQPGDSLITFGGTTGRHWTARAISAVGRYAAANHRSLIGTAIALVGVTTAVVGVLRH